jgi:F-type H+-transporting ATPase subunit gamma
MSRYRRVELHLEQLKELQSIITSMKTLAQLELHKLVGGMVSQRAMMRMLEQVVADFLMFFPRPVPSRGNALWLVFGSERGFCGNFNELLIRRLLHECPLCTKNPQRVLAVGRKICERLNEALPGYIGLTGASAGEEIPSVLTQVVAATQKHLTANNATALWVVSHNDEPSKIIFQRLLPPEEACLLPRRGHPPMLYSQPDRFFSDFLQHYLLFGLTQFCTSSLLAENEYRIRHLEGAVHRLDERLATLSSRARTLRQEEIIEEIEIILLGSGTFDPLDRNA